MQSQRSPGNRVTGGSSNSGSGSGSSKKRTPWLPPFTTSIAAAAAAAGDPAAIAIPRQIARELERWLDKPLSEITDLSHIPVGRERDHPSHVSFLADTRLGYQADRRYRGRDDQDLYKLTPFYLYYMSYKERAVNFCKKSKNDDLVDGPGWVCWHSWQMETDSERDLFNYGANVEADKHKEVFSDYEVQPVGGMIWVPRV